MQYLDFEVQVSADATGRYRVEVVDSPAGECDALVQPIDDLQFVDRLRAIDAQRRSMPTRSAAARDLVPNDSDALALQRSAQQFGRALFEFLLPAEVLAVYRSSLSIARRDGCGLRLRLRLQAPELATLPWELLHDALEGDHTCLRPETPLIRHLEIARAHEALTIAPPLRILGLIASPAGLPALDVERERRDMGAAIQHLVDAGYASIDWVEGQTWRHLHGAMLANRAHVLHFIGHGGFDPATGEGLIALAGDDGDVDRVSATRLGRLLAGHNRLRLVVLNSCEGARGNTGDLHSSVAGTLIRQGVPAVVSMQYEITDTAALEFSRTFYDALAQHLPVDTAVTEARKAIALAAEHSVEFATPVLHMRSPDGALFDIDLASALFERSGPDSTNTSEPAAESGPRTVRTLIGGGSAEHGGQDSRTAPAAPGAHVRSALLVLLEKTRRQWITDVLERSLARSGLIELHLDAAATMVESPWGSIAISPGQSITDVFEEMGGCFLILGVPGSGKTTAMLMLARDLLERAETDPGRQIPVVFNLSSLKQGESLVEWLASELGSKYQVPRRVGERWIGERRLMLLLDGLDETEAGQRTHCVEAVNRFMATGPGLNIVVCCRLNEYLQLPVRLQLNGAVTVRTLSREQVLAHVHAQGTSYSGLLHALQHDTSLQLLAQTPFMLSLMLQTYGDVPVERAQGFATIESRKNELMAAYVQRQFRIVAPAGVA